MSIIYSSSVDEVHTYQITFHGRQILTTVTSHPHGVDNWVMAQDFSASPIALATKPFRNEFGPAIVQISCNDSCLIYQICHSGVIPASLLAVFGNPDYTIVGVSINKIIGGLSNRYNLQEVLANRVELRDLIDLTFRKWRIRKLARIMLAMPYNTPTKVKRSRWSKKMLGNRQVQFATFDVVATSLLARHLMLFPVA